MTTKIKLPAIISHRFITIIFAASFSLVLLGLFLVYINFSDSGRPLIVHFDVFRGVDFFGSRTEVLSIIFVSLSVLVINLFLAAVLLDRERILAYFLAIAGFVFSFLVLVALSVIISVN